MTTGVARYRLHRPTGSARYLVKVWRPADHPRDPATGRFISAPGGNGRDRPQVGAVTRRRITTARRSLPGDWRAPVVRQDRPVERVIDRNVAEAETLLAQARRRHAKAEHDLRAVLDRQQLSAEERAAIEQRNLLVPRMFVERAESTLTHLRQLAADPSLATRPDGADLVRMMPATTTPDYPVDGGGTAVPPAAFDKALDQVLDVGRALHGDFTRENARDPALVRLRAALASPELAPEKIMEAVGDERFDLRTKRLSYRMEIRTREQRLLLDLLRSARSFGSTSHTRAEPASYLHRRLFGGSADPARDDWQERLHQAEQFFPDDWIRLSDRTPLRIASSPRAFYDGPYGASAGLLAMPTTDRDQVHYEGAFDDYTAEAILHELGHRMEATVPGLQELEFTFMRRRTTRAGAVERPQTLAELTGLDYNPRERAYRDGWTNPYIGRTYERLDRGEGGEYLSVDTDPGARPWEVFAAGLQDTFGRLGAYGDDELQQFVLGSLATLAHPREDT